MDSPFMILGFPERGDQDVVYVEQMSQAMYVETAAEVDWYTLAFDHLRARALDPDESLARIVAVRNTIGPD